MRAEEEGNGHAHVAKHMLDELDLVFGALTSYQGNLDYNLKESLQPCIPTL